MLDLQVIFNWAAGILLTIVGFFARNAIGKVDKTAESLAAFQLEVAKDYVNHNDLRRLEDTLIRIEAKLDAKADK